MPDIDLDPLLAPLGEREPCGADLEYDAEFQALQQAAAGRPEQQWGATRIEAVPPDWSAVRDSALALARRTRDLRVAVWLVRAAAHVDGLEAVVDGLRLLHGLVERHWEAVHPMPDDGDPTARVNALRALAHAEGLADLRQAPLVRGRAPLRVREIELAFGGVEPLPREPVPSRDGVAAAVAALQVQSPRLAAAMAAGAQSAEAIVAILDAQLGAAQAPDLAPVVRLMRAVAEAGRQAQQQQQPAQQEQAVAGQPAPRAADVIESREDAIGALDRVCVWIERNEPASPAPLLIRRAQRLMRKNFMEIVRDLLPDGLPQIERLAGPKAD